MSPCLRFRSARRRFAALVFIGSAFAASRVMNAQGAAAPVIAPPPPATGVRQAPAIGGPNSPALKAAAETIYSIGDPTPEEQLYVEFINRARANPPGEGVILHNTTDADVLSAYQYFQVDLDLMQAAFSAVLPAPPVAINAQLTAAARGHSQDMFDRQFQGHNGTDGSDPGGRITAAGYNWTAYAENVFAYSKSVFFGHAAFEVDWGAGAGGMQTPPDHRVSIHNPIYREIGVGVVDGSNGSVGPQVVTQDFGRSVANTPFLTGVAYLDQNGNQFYDLGEGLGGVRVTVDGQPGAAITASSGGYSFPLPADGTYTVTFTASGYAPQTQTVTVSGGANVKLDYRPIPSNASPAQVRITRISIGGAGTVLIDFVLESGSATLFTLQSAAQISGGWAADASASVEPTGANTFRAATTAAASAFYRIAAQ